MRSKPNIAISVGTRQASAEITVKALNDPEIWEACTRRRGSIGLAHYFGNRGVGSPVKVTVPPSGEVERRCTLSNADFL